jgi:alpha-ketoglutarate-dependent taurine dioxygenase
MSMTTIKRGTFNLEKVASIRPRTVSVSQAELVRTEYLEQGSTLPLVVKPNFQNLDLAEWAKSQLELIQTQLLKHGAILFRDFNINSADKFRRFAQSISPTLLKYKERSTPRTEVGGEIYTATEYSADQRIPLHNENAYSFEWPLKLWFLCLQPATEGGQTPIADSRKVTRLLDPKIKERFVRKKVMYVRNYGEGIDLSWQTTFQTTDKSAVEDYCRKAFIEFEWREKNQLRTRQVRPATAIHPVTGETIWFNQAHLFHVSSLEPSLREALLALVKEENLSRNTYYGDGTPIETSILDEIRGVYEDVAVTFSWHEGDVLMLDNMLTAHGRTSFIGPRKVLVAMAETFSDQNS